MQPDSATHRARLPADTPRWYAFLHPITLAAAVYVYVCLPRAVLVAFVSSTELQFTRGFVDQTLAFVGVTSALYYAVQLIGVRWLRAVVRIAWHVEFAARAGEALLMYVFGMGYSPLVFYHVDPMSMRLALSQDGAVLACVVVCALCADRLVSRVSPFRSWRAAASLERLVICAVLLFGVRSASVLHRERARLPQDFAAASLVDNWRSYDATPAAERVTATSAERREIKTLGIDTAAADQAVVQPPRRANLVTIYLEGFQANFTASGHSVYAGLTPNLDRFAARSQVFDHFYNAVTPTINAIISSQCGILSEVENGYLDIDRGYTRNLTCLSDILHRSGYQQVFLGGAESSFSGKRAFLAAHHYDEVDGLEQWRENPAYAEDRLNAWGLQDTDLAREAIARLPALKAAHRPFHLSLLTVNTHEPGYVAADCPTYLPDRTMLNAIHCTDHAIGGLLDALDAQGLMDDTVVMVMGDHMMFPSGESRAALGAASAGWFGQIFMAIHRPGGHTGSVTSAPSYTPDFAPTALEALGFNPVPTFVVGRPRLAATDYGRILVAPRFEVVNGGMSPSHPDVADDCTADIVDHIELRSPLGELTPCERDRIMAIIAQSLMAPLERRTD